jgi:hypothetical protein
VRQDYKKINWKRSVLSLVCRRKKLLDARKLRRYRQQWGATAGPGRHAASTAATYCNTRSYVQELIVQCCAMGKADCPIFVTTNPPPNAVHGDHSYAVARCSTYEMTEILLLYNDQRNAQVFNSLIYLLLPYMFRAFF